MASINNADNPTASNDIYNNFVHLHVHTEYSLLDGYGSCLSRIQRAKELGMKSIAITDHNQIGGCVDFFNACRKQEIKPILGCCMPSQIIYTIDGPKEIKDIKVGDYVLTHNGRYRKVLRHWNKNFEGTLYGINSWNNNIVWLTNEHPIYVKETLRTGKTSSTKYIESMKWIRVDELNLEKPYRTKNDSEKVWKYYSVLPKHHVKDIDFVEIINYIDNDLYMVNNDGYITKKVKKNKYDSLTNIKKIKNKIKITPQLMKLFGFFIAEGNYSKNNKKDLTGVQFTFNIKETEYHKEVIDSFKNIFDIDCHCYERPNKSTTDLLCSNVIIANFFFGLFNEYSHNKVFPTWFLNLNELKQNAFLEGIYNGDGKVTKNDITIKLANKNLIYQIRLILANLGYASKITKVHANFHGKNLTHWSLRFTIDKNKRIYYKEDNGYIYMPIKEIKQKQYEGLVYNFEVEEDNSYVSDIILHNCELYYTEDTKILSLPPEERDALAIEKAKEDGLEIPEFKTKKIPKKIKEFIKDYQYDTKQYHIIFLAKNQKGWNNLIKLQSEAARVCHYEGNFTCDDDLILKYKDGLIMTTACVSSIINSYLKKGMRDKALMKLNKWKAMFGDDFYVEIQPWNSEQQAEYNLFLIEYSVNTNTPLICTNDVHYTSLDDVDFHDTLLCIGTGKYKSDTNRMKYDPEFWLRSYDEMIEAFTNQYNSQDALHNITLEEYLKFIYIGLGNTNLISDKIENNIKLGSDTTILPKVKTETGLPPEKDLTLSSYKNLYKYLRENPDLNRDEYINRLSFELNVINSKGYADYMLIVKELINWCESEDIPVGPGRGSASGSLCLFVNGITKCIDPIKYGLLFSRFLTMDRTALPDIDSDFSYRNRGKVIQHLKDKYGEDCVCNIGTYTDMGIKISLKDVGRVFGIDFDVMNELSKKIDLWTNEEPGFKFKNLDELKDGGDLDKKFYEEFKEYENKYPELFKTARALEGTHRNQGTHASGILVTPMPINDIFPTRLDKDNRAVTLYTGEQCEALGSCKLDILGLKTLDVLDLTVKAKDPKDTVYNLYKRVDNYLNDKKMFNSLNNRETEGIFQLESKLFKGLIKDIQPESIEDITVITSLGKSKACRV